MDWPKCINERQMIQTKILEFIDEIDDMEEDFQNVKSLFNRYIVGNDKYELKFVLYLISSITKNHFRTPNFIAKIEKMLLFLKNEILEKLSNFEIFNIFKANKRILLFLIDEKIIKLNDSVVSEMTSSKCIKKKYHQYFFPEINEHLKDGLLREILKESPELFVELVDEKSQEINIESKIRINIINNDYFNEKRKVGENSNLICEIIRNDLIEDFITHSNKKMISLTGTIDQSIFETNSYLLKKQKVSYIEYAAFYGSIQIFRFLHKNNVQITPKIWTYAVHGQNPELIQYLKSNEVFEINNESIIESIKCHHNEMAEYFNKESNGWQLNYNKNEVIKAFIKYFNYMFFSMMIWNKQLWFYLLCKYDHCKLVKLFLENKYIDINEIIVD